MSKSASTTPSSIVTRPFSIFIEGLGSAGLEKAAKPFLASSAANLSSRSGRLSQSPYRRQRLDGLVTARSAQVSAKSSMKLPDRRGHHGAPSGSECNVLGRRAMHTRELIQP